MGPFPARKTIFQSSEYIPTLNNLHRLETKSNTYRVSPIVRKTRITDSRLYSLGRINRDPPHCIPACRHKSVVRNDRTKQGCFCDTYSKSRLKEVAFSDSKEERLLFTPCQRLYQGDFRFESVITPGASGTSQKNMTRSKRFLRLHVSLI